MTRDQVDAALVELGSENKRLFEQALAKLRASMLKTDPIKLLSNLAFFGQLHPEGTDPELEGGLPHLQLHFELVHAFSLMHDKTEFGFDIAVPPPLVQQVFDLIEQVATSFGLKGLAVASTPTTDQERRRLVCQATIRMHTIAVRNPGYPDQLKRLFTELIAPLDDACQAETGLRLTSLLEFLWNVIDLTESRANVDAQKFASVFDAPTIEDAVNAYHEAYPGLKGEPAATAAILRARGTPLLEAKLFLLSHRSISFPEYFTLMLDDLVHCYSGSVTIDQLREVMNVWSLTFGELAGHDPEHFFLDNPVWSQPFIKLNDDEFFCPVPGVLWSFSLRLIEEFVNDKTTLKARYERRRDKFLESQVEAAFRRAFPTAQVFVGSIWNDALLGREGENDLLVVIGDVALVIEDKAGGISDKALRALPERLKSTLGDLVVKPAEQAGNFIALLERDPGPHSFRTVHGQVNEVDVSSVRRYIPISVTWETFGAFRMRWPLLQGAGLIPEGAEPTVTMSLAELETVLDVLDSEISRLHYFARRSELELNERITGDEIDLLGHYLNTGFRGTELAIDREELVDLSMQAKHVDSVAQSPPRDRLTIWPGTRLAPLWQSLLTDLHTRRPGGWVKASLLLANVPFSQQRQFEHLVERVASKVSKARPSRTYKQDRRNFGPSGLTLEALVFKGFGNEEMLDVGRAAANLDDDPAVVPVCVRVERRNSPVIGL